MGKPERVGHDVALFQAPAGALPVTPGSLASTALRCRSKTLQT